MTLRRLLATVLATGGVLLSTACGSETSGGIGAELTQANFASAVGEATRQHRSVHVEGRITTQGHTVTMSGDITMPRKLRDLAASMEMSAGVQGRFEMRIVDKVMYLTGAGLSRNPRKPWVRIPLTGSDNPLGAMMAQSMENANPASQVKLFRAVTALENEGQEEVDGVETTHYTVTVDMEKAIKVSGMAKASGVDPRQLAAQLPDTVTSDVWVGVETALIVRMTMDMDVVSMDMHFSDWGKQVNVVEPPKGKTTTFRL